MAQGFLRVIAGSAKGVRLEAPAGMGTRPTLDKVREAVFGSLQFQIRSARCLDLFSGSGAMGIEALSRGAGECVFSDVSIECVKLIGRNLKKAGFESTVICADYKRVLKELDGAFDFIFMDPPYASGFYQPAADEILERGLLNEDGMLVVEHDGSLVLKGFAEGRTRKYGAAFITYYTNGEISR